MITVAICVILAVLLFLATCLAVYYRKEAETAIDNRDEILKEFFKAKVAWNQGMDELEEMYQMEALTQGELSDLILFTLEAEYDLRVDAERNLKAYREVAIEKQIAYQAQYERVQLLLDERRGLQNQLEQQLSETISSRSELSAMQALFTDLNTAHDELDELYGEAATELLETHAIIEEVASDVRSWMGGSTDPDA